MRAYIIRRLLLIIPTMFLLSILVFLSVRFIPGDVIDVMLMRMASVGGEWKIDREALEHMLGLDVPGYVQYARWIGGIFLHGSLGESLMGRGAVEEQIIYRLPVTIELGLLAIVIGLLIALPVVSGINLFFAMAVVGINLMIDLIYPYIDPRVRYR